MKNFLEKLYSYLTSMGMLHILLNFFIVTISIAILSNFTYDAVPLGMLIGLTFSILKEITDIYRNGWRIVYLECIKDMSCNAIGMGLAAGNYYIFA